MVVPKGRSTILRGVCRGFWREASKRVRYRTYLIFRSSLLARTSLRGCLCGYAQPIVVTPLCTGEGDTGMACAHPSVGAGSRVAARLDLAGSGQCSEWLQTTLQQGGDFHRPLRLHVIICDPCFQRHPLIAPSCRDGSVQRLPPRMRTPAEPVTAPHPPPTTPPLTSRPNPQPSHRNGEATSSKVGGRLCGEGGRVVGGGRTSARLSPPKNCVCLKERAIDVPRVEGPRVTLDPVWLLQLARRSQRSQYVPSPT
jgi:hypothetical protein